MFAVMFEVYPRPDRWDSYLDTAGMLRPELEQIDGFIENIRYRSLKRDGWLLSLSIWRDEKSVIRWRTRMRHHVAQEKGRSEILLDYHLRVGEISRDSSIPPAQPLDQQRLDETEVGAGTAATLIDAKRPPDWIKSSDANEAARSFGLQGKEAGLVDFDVFDAVLTPGDTIVLTTWRNQAAAEAFEATLSSSGARFRRVRIVRDYGMFDRREAPQYYPDAPGRSTVHA